MSEIGLKNPGVANAVAFPGLSISGLATAATRDCVLPLKDFELRTSPNFTDRRLPNQLMAADGEHPDAFMACSPSPVNGWGHRRFKLQVGSRADLGTRRCMTR